MHVAHERRGSLVAVAFGGGLGALARYEISARFAPTTPPAFPIVTLAVNVSGAFALGFLLTLVLDVWPPTRFVRPFACIGVLGGFTTLSTFSVESARLLQAHLLAEAFGYMAASMMLGFLAVHLGSLAARLWTPAVRLLRRRSEAVE